MKKSVVFLVVQFFVTSAFAEWEPVAECVEYQRFVNGAMDVHVARIDLSSDDIRLIATRESEKGTRVSEFAKRNNALVAINADYFDKTMTPIGLSIGPCGPWTDSIDTSREGVVAFGSNRLSIQTPKLVMESPEGWIRGAVSGWPMLVSHCKALTPAELPGSDGFTRAPHPRTAVGLSEDGLTLYLVVADGRRPDVPGLTLAQLAAWMSEQFNVCTAINLDGGGSSAMWVGDAIVNKPSDGIERRVANHLAVIPASEETACDPIKERAKARP